MKRARECTVKYTQQIEHDIKEKEKNDYEYFDRAVCIISPTDMPSTTIYCLETEGFPDVIPLEKTKPERKHKNA